MFYISYHINNEPNFDRDKIYWTTSNSSDPLIIRQEISNEDGVHQRNIEVLVVYENLRGSSDAF